MSLTGQHGHLCVRVLPIHLIEVDTGRRNAFIASGWTTFWLAKHGRREAPGSSDAGIGLDRGCRKWWPRQSRRQL